MAFGLRRAKGLGELSVKLVSKISDLCGPDPPTSQTDRRTDRQTDRQTTCDRNTALCTKVHRAVKMRFPHGIYLYISIYTGRIIIRPLLCHRNDTYIGVGREGERHMQYRPVTPTFSWGPVLILFYIFFKILPISTVLYCVLPCGEIKMCILMNFIPRKRIFDSVNKKRETYKTHTQSRLCPHFSGVLKRTFELSTVCNKQ